MSGDHAFRELPIYLAGQPIHEEDVAFGIQPSLGTASAHAQGTAFTYQRRLGAGGRPYTGLAKMQSSLWDAASGGCSRVGSTLTVSPVGVSNGVFAVTLNFGNQFPGADQWLEIAVQTNLLSFVTLSPRVRYTATPYAIWAADAGKAASATSVAVGCCGHGGGAGRLGH
ncbi:MAG: hypothetical protein RMN51_05665 [Verrucomicrobiota bacterium]|nr:hypothetical protein [Limisphaera sp.]MDW8381578.1 hypothetical protein [Verrucomicrobiota bacterium]